MCCVFVLLFDWSDEWYVVGDGWWWIVGFFNGSWFREEFGVGV